MSRTIAAVILAIAVVIAAELVADGLVVHGVISCALAAVGALCVAVAVRRYRPGRLGTLLLAATTLNFCAMVAWYSPVLAGEGTTLGQPSIADGGWLIADALLAATIVYALSRRERARFVVLDVLTIGAALALVAGVSLIGPDFGTSTAPLEVRTTQACYVVTDLFVAASVLRVLLAPRGRGPGLWLLAAAGAALVVSDFAWNWLTISGTYTPGSWADVGWSVQPLLMGIAALHPSLWAQPARDEDELRSSSTVLLGFALAVAPLLLGAHQVLPFIPDVDDKLASAIAVAGGGTVLGALVVLRFMLLLRRTRRFAAAAAAALRERDELLTRSQSRYRALVEQLPAITIVLALDDDDRTVHPFYVSPQTEVIVGVGADEWESGSILERVHPEDVAKLEHALTEVVATGASAPVEVRAVRADGDEIWLGDVGAVLNEDSSGRYIQTMVFDISDAKRAQAERETMDLELRLGQKLEAVGELAAGIAHEINTPTQFVGDTVRFLRDAFGDLMELHRAQAELVAAAEAGTISPDLVARVREAEEHADLDYLRERVPGAFDRADDGIARVASIVGAMREFAHPPTADKAPVLLNDALENTLVVATSEYKYVADVETDFADLPPVVCNGGDINQVFLNLIVNAAHAIEQRGSERGTIRVSTRLQGDHVVVSVADTGCGIPDGLADRIFDPFFTTKEVGRGTGQGLAIARALVVDRHGGSLTFDSQVGEGATFHVSLPIGHLAAVEAAVA